MFTIPCPRIESKEDIYDDLCYVTFQANLPEVRHLMSIFLWGTQLHSNSVLHAIEMIVSFVRNLFQVCI